MSQNFYHDNSFIDFNEERKRLNSQARTLYEFELEILKKHGLKEHHTVLDVGCGEGFLSYVISDYLTTGSIDGVDINAAFIRAAQTNFISDKLTYHCSGILAYTPEKQYDFIYARLVFQHLEDPFNVIRCLKKLLKPEGKLCIIDVNDEWLFLEPYLPAFDCLIKESIAFQQEYGGDRLIAKKLPGLLRQAGLEALQIEIMPFSSDLVGMKLFLDVAISFRANFAYANINGQELYEDIKDSVFQASVPYFGLMGVSYISAFNSKSILQ